MKPQLTLAGLVAAAALLSFPPSFSPAPPPEGDALTVASASCEPSAPVEIEILDSSVVNGVAAVRYRVLSRIDAARVETSLDMPDGGALLQDRRVRAVDVVRGGSRVGSARVRLPAGADGARLTVRAAVTFEASGGALDGRLETAITDRTLVWGTVDTTPDLPLVVSAGTVTLDVPAARTGGQNRGENR